MKSLLFTKTPLKKKKPVVYGTNKMGQYYSNEKVLIKNFTTTSVSKRIDKNMSSLQVTVLTDKKLNKFIDNAIETETFVEIIVETNIVEMNLEVNDKNFNNFVNEVKPTENFSKQDIPDVEINNKNFTNFPILSENIMSDADNNDNIKIQRQKLYKKTQIDIFLQILHITNLTIENVYQEKYGNVNSSGIGDFLRGSYFLMQFCEQYNFSYNINILNHPISQFLEIYQGFNSSSYSIVSVFGESGFQPHYLEDNILSNNYDYEVMENFIFFLHKQPKYNKKIYTHVISYPETLIQQKHKTYMKHLLKPSNDFLTIINNTLTKLEIVEKDFTIIHVRYGDKFLLNSDNIDRVSSKHLKIIERTIERLDFTQNILLISDNTTIKNIITTKYKFIKTHFNEITHTGEGRKLETEQLQNTMLDFYLFSLAKKILAFSVYAHGTGFSKWAAETYSVPYVCRFLN